MTAVMLLYGVVLGNLSCFSEGFPQVFFVSYKRPVFLSALPGEAAIDIWTYIRLTVDTVSHTLKNHTHMDRIEREKENYKHEGKLVYVFFCASLFRRICFPHARLATGSLGLFHSKTHVRNCVPVGETHAQSKILHEKS